jgi:hypothetical protein
MKNLTLPTQEQVKSNIEHFLNISGNSAINIDNMGLYLTYIKGLILGFFEAQKVEFNSDDFFKMYHLYTDNVLKCKCN